MAQFFQPETADEARNFLFTHCMTPEIRIKKVSLDSQGRVDVVGTVYFLEPAQRGTITHQLPMRFGHIDGSFIARSLKLTSLEGAPHTVNGEFTAQSNQLTSLAHGPVHVKELYVVNHNPLKSLEGFPEHLGREFSFTYHDQLPLLRALTAPGIWPEPDQVELEHIFKKYMHKGKSAALNCALELKQAGYAGNARW